MKAVEGAAAGVDNAQLRKLLQEHWDYRLRNSPVWATTQGDHRFDDKLGDTSQKSIDESRTANRRFLRRAKALASEEFSSSDKITLSLFVERLSNEIESEVCEFHKWMISARGNGATAYNRLYKQHPLKTEDDGKNLIARYSQIASNVDSSLENLRSGLAIGLVANAESLKRLVSMLDGQLGKPTSEWSMLDPLKTVDELAWSSGFKADFADQMTSLVEEKVRPAIVRYRDAVKNELLPKARGKEAEGLTGLETGKACYGARIRSHTSLDMPAMEIHKVGLAEIAKINKEMEVLGQKLFKTKKLPRVLKRLRTDKTLYYETKEQIISDAEAAVADAKKKIPDFFGILPKASVDVVPVPEVEAPFTTIAYYWPPHADGSKNGEYYVNTYRPEIRPRYEMQVLSFHEAIPGHHLQIAISQERGALPSFRRFGGSTAFVEGWALYTERLSEEMGLYTSDLDRMGVLSFDAWRASRLVVDTGVHALGWTRAQAEKFMLEHTALTEENIANEVDRYISTPGQALAYKLGQLEILRLRRKAEKELGDLFDIKGFHDTVLRSGAVTLPVLLDQVNEWIIELGKTRNS